MTQSILLIDVQQGLCEGEQAAFESQAVIARINIVCANARAAGLPVVFIQHESTSGYLAWGTREWQLAQRLHAEPTDIFVR